MLLLVDFRWFLFVVGSGWYIPHLNVRLSLSASVWALVIAAITSSSSFPAAAIFIPCTSSMGGSPIILMRGAPVARARSGPIRMDAKMICTCREPVPSTHQGQPTAEMLLMLAMALCPHAW